MENERVAVLAPCQIWDGGRGCFFVGIQTTTDRHLGLPIYKDAFGKRFVIKGKIPHGKPRAETL